MTDVQAHQMAMEAIVQHDTDQLDWWGGYTFGWPACLGDYAPWCKGCVTTPRWARRAHADSAGPYILDNGAWPAYASGSRLTFREQVDAIARSVDLLGAESIRWVVLPDRIGDAEESLIRTRRAMRELMGLLPPNRWMLAVQEGADLADYIDYAETLGCALFIGGKSRRFKFQTTRNIRKREAFDGHIHIGRISSEAHLHHAAWLGADSFDTTTYLRSYGTNQHTDYTHRLNRYCRRHQ